MSTLMDVEGIFGLQVPCEKQTKEWENFFFM